MREEKIAENDKKTLRIGTLILINAVLLQEMLSKTYPTVRTITQTIDSEDKIRQFITVWKKIENDLGFTPVFRVAHEVLEVFVNYADFDPIFEKIIQTGQAICAKNILAQHDFLGRILHRLLKDAKYYGACYTRIPASYLMIKLLFDSNEWEIDWTDAESISKLRISDLACGTGTLLKSSLSYCIQKHNKASFYQHINPQSTHLSEELIQKSIYGFDVVPSAINLATSALVMHDRNVKIKNTNIFTVPLYIKKSTLSRNKRLKDYTYSLGSIEFAKNNRIQVQKTILGASVGPSTMITEGKKTISIPLLDICVMNPPYTRSVHSNLIFGGIGSDEEDRTILQEALSDIRSKCNLNADIKGGLGPIFVALGDKYLKEGGSMGLVLPKSVIVGSSWEQTREIFQKYQIQYIISSHEFANWQFSESTNLSEVILVLRKLKNKEVPQSTIYLNLWSQPSSYLESLSIASLICENPIPDLLTLQEPLELRIDGKKFGEVFKVLITNKKAQDTNQHSMDVFMNPNHKHHAKTTSSNSFGSIDRIPMVIPAAFAQTLLVQCAIRFANNLLQIPGTQKQQVFETVKLSKLFNLGPDWRMVITAFKESTVPTEYHALIGMDSDTLIKISGQTNGFLIPYDPSTDKESTMGDTIRNPTEVFVNSGFLMLPKELRLNTNKMTGIVVDFPALSNVFWPTTFKAANDEKQRFMEQRLALWINSSLGILSMLMCRQETEGNWIKFPKTWWEELAILDFTKLDPTKLHLLDELWGRIQEKEFQILPHMHQDPLRIEIDHAFADILHLPDLAPLRELIVHEPILFVKPKKLQDSAEQNDREIE